MAIRQFRLFSYDLFNFKHQIRHGHRMRGKPPTEARTLKQRLDEIKQKEREYAMIHEVDIGLKVPVSSRKDMMTKWMDEVKAQRDIAELERRARKKNLTIDLEKAKDDWLKTIAPYHKRKIAEHYGIFKDLYGDAYFMPVVPLDIQYSVSHTLAANVHTGNVIKPSEASKAPTVVYNAKPTSLWTLIMCTPDGNMINSENEYCHWFIGNIPGNDIAKGEQIVDYLQPIPPRGIGYCRYIFVLYKQEEHIDYTEYKRSQPCTSLMDRNFKTYDFYRKYQDILTPAGLAFFQSDWDISLKDFYYNVLQMKEPVFMYDFPKPYLRPQEWFPLRRPFNTYLDRYRDPKQINKEFLLKKLKKVHPFKGPEPALKYPNAHFIPASVPSWLQVEMKKERLGWGWINEIK